ncbi:MAG: DNA polymerase III subunit delta [Candidatus Saganbacteria bacterium]|nr:DNA polymerase III subunit delta [Candidatus Saganbacteria bacterium]
MVKGEGKSIGSHAARLLMEISGKNLRALYSEIQKLVTYIGEKHAIEEQDVKAIASSFGIGVFSLLGALRNKDIKTALHSVSMLLRNREEPVKLLGLLATQYRRMLEVKSLMGSSRDYREIAQVLNANPYFVRKCGEGAENFSLGELVKDMELLHNADLKLKKGSPGGLTFELLVLELCGV